MINESASSPPNPLKTAVLFMIFNRLETARQVFEAIRQAKPPRIYIAADGPRESHTGEADKVQAVRNYVVNSIDWECDVKTLFRENNIGCKRAVSGAITWFFENEEMGIILEDDCLPMQSFFWFCEELLERFRYEPRMFMISGRNELGYWNPESYSYFYTLGSIWGWAGWRRAWMLYDPDLKLWCDAEAHKNIADFTTFAPSKAKDVLNGCKAVLAGKVSTWDYQWTFSRMAQRGLGVVPTVNLIENIGFDLDGTHTTDSKSPTATLKAGEILFPLKHNPHLEIDQKYYNIIYKNMNSRFARIKTFVSKMVMSVIKKT